MGDSAKGLMSQILKPARVDQITHDLTFPIKSSDGGEIAALTFRVPTGADFMALPKVQEFYSIGQNGMPIPILAAMVQLMMLTVQGDVMEPEINQLHPTDLQNIGVHMGLAFFMGLDPEPLKVKQETGPAESTAPAASSAAAAPSPATAETLPPLHSGTSPAAS